MQKHIAYISVGSNIGNKFQNCQNGVAALSRLQTIVMLAQSQIYKSEPVDYRNQDWFVNYAVKIETSLDPFQLLTVLKSIQHRAGRFVDPIRFGPRILDLDIVFYDDRVINSSKLVVPHPRMHKRRFVLKPICDIDPGIIHPVLKQSMRCLLDGLNDDGQEVQPYP